MIIHHSESDLFGLTILPRIHGSAVYKAFVPSLVSTGVLLALHYAFDDPNAKLDERWFGHPYPLASMVVAFTFLLTFKCSFSYNRYWEACTAVHQMHSKWLDVAMELGAFHLQSDRYNDIKPPSFGSHPHMQTLVRTRERQNQLTPSQFMENVDISSRSLSPRRKSCYRASVVSNIDSSSRSSSPPRRDSGHRVSFVDNIYSDRNQRHNEAPQTQQPQQFPNSLIPVPSKLSHGLPSPPRTPTRSSGRMFSRLAPRTQRSSILVVDPTQNQHMNQEPSLFLQEVAHLCSLLSAVAFSTLRGDIEGVDIPLKTYNPGDPWPAMDPDEDADVKSKSNDFYHTPQLFRVAKFLFGVSRTPEQQTIYNACREFGVLGGISDSECDMLRSARGPLAKTALCTFWLQEFMSREFIHGSLGKVAAPIVSRLYQYTSDGMIGYNQARKIAYTPFPFPHTQLTAVYIAVMMIILPILMLSFVKTIVTAAFINCLTVTVFVGLHEVSKELEEPFRNAPNDLPLNNFQAQFNEALVTIYAGYHPESWWVVDDDESQHTATTTTTTTTNTTTTTAKRMEDTANLNVVESLFPALSTDSEKDESLFPVQFEQPPAIPRSNKKKESLYEEVAATKNSLSFPEDETNNTSTPNTTTKFPAREGLDAAQTAIPEDDTYSTNITPNNTTKFPTRGVMDATQKWEEFIATKSNSIDSPPSNNPAPVKES